MHTDPSSTIERALRLVRETTAPLSTSTTLGGDLPDPTGILGRLGITGPTATTAPDPHAATGLPAMNPPAAAPSSMNPSSMNRRR